MRKFDAPLFCAAWATANGDGNGDGRDTDTAAAVSARSYVVCGGGGGGGSTGVRNLIVAAEYDPESRDLSDPVHVLLTERDTICAMAVHPGGHEILCSFASRSSHSGKLKVFKLGGGEKIEIQAVDREVKPLQDIGEQRCVVFNLDGKMLATGGENGHLRVFRWPSLELVLDRGDAHTSIKDLDFSLDGTVLAATDDGGPSRIWDLKGLSPAATLPLNRAGFCRFSRDGARQCLYVTSAEGGRGIITVWSNRWAKITSRKIQDEPISAFNISSDGKLLAVGSPEGHVSILASSKLTVLQRVKAAHMVFVTALSFSPDNRLLLSVSGDSSARVTQCSRFDRGRLASVLWFILIAAILVSLSFRSGLGQNMLDTIRSGSSDSPSLSHDLI